MKKDKALAFAFLASILTGCATSTEYVRTPLANRIPAGLLTCRDRPPAGSLDRQSNVARYVVDLDAAGEDCRRKVAGIKTIVDADTAAPAP